MYNPSNPTEAEIAKGWSQASDFEYIELQNISAQTLDLFVKAVAVVKTRQRVALGQITDALGDDATRGGPYEPVQCAQQC